MKPSHAAYEEAFLAERRAARERRQLEKGLSVDELRDIEMRALERWRAEIRSGLTTAPAPPKGRCWLRRHGDPRPEDEELEIGTVEPGYVLLRCADGSGMEWKHVEYFDAIELPDPAVDDPRWVRLKPEGIE